ncbi:Protein CLEC16A [Penaeus vannamei]|uniref:Protein CLEC16A n=1 Tax=Penaeus vannamei TaxID=6689 RepID=A0A423U018_PENVA|nr:Protein CLEC16A [Penaeus vannamei]
MLLTSTYLYNVLSKNQVVQDSNRGLLVETLRSIAEILIWGDQNDSSVFDFFLEKNMLSFFLRIMKQKCGSYVCVQLLQTLNILFENIRNETSLYYLLSNNHVNSIIVHKFDFSDEEVMAYYISFLKTLSLKLNAHTIHFFYNEHTNDFPLYTEAIKFFNHPESMVRIAVRTLTLNVYRVNDQSMLQFIRDRTAAPYFSNLVWFIGNHILELENCVRSDVDHNSRGRLADLVAEHLDHLHYLNDILRLDITALNVVLADHLLNRLLVPLLVYSLNPRQEKDDRPRVSSVVSLFLLAQVFLIVSHAPLVRALAKIIFHADNSIFSEDTIVLQELNIEREADRSLLTENISKGQRLIRRGFIAPEEPLEKSLQARTSSGSGSSSSHSPSGRMEGASGSEGGSAGEGQEAVAATTDQDAEEAALCRELGVSSPTAEIMACIGISDLEATHVNITDEEKEQLRASDQAGACAGESQPKERPVTSRPFLQSIFSSLDCSGDDYSALFGLSLLYALGHNPVTSASLSDRVSLGLVGRSVSGDREVCVSDESGSSSCSLRLRPPQRSCVSMVRTLSLHQFAIYYCRTLEWFTVGWAASTPQGQARLHAPAAVQGLCVPGPPGAGAGSRGTLRGSTRHRRILAPASRRSRPLQRVHARCALSRHTPHPRRSQPTTSSMATALDRNEHHTRAHSEGRGNRSEHNRHGPLRTTPSHRLQTDLRTMSIWPLEARRRTRERFTLLQPTIQTGSNYSLDDKIPLI